MDSIATSSTEDSDGEDINRGGLLVALFIVVIFVVAFCLFAFSSVCDIFCISYQSYSRGMEELITASRGRRRAVIAPSRDGNDDHHSADADPVARASRRASALVKSMSYDERVIYVTDLLNTQKLKAPQIADLDDDVVKESGQKLDNNPDAYENESQNVEESGNISIRNCAICFEMFVPNDAICTSNNPDCNHVYHHECIFNWLLKNEDCPCCRRDYLAFEPISGCI